jgi:molybdenum cofactor synthesis domain-containing protein
MTFTFGVLTISDRCFRGEAKDTAGPALARLLEEQLAAAPAKTGLVPDERDQISATIAEWASEDDPPGLIITTGGTGLAPRDVTPEATRDVIEREHPGLMELVRAKGAQATPRSYLSRGIAGTVGRTLVINLPGSPKGSVESLEALLELLPHAVALVRDEPIDH